MKRAVLAFLAVGMILVVQATAEASPRRGRVVVRAPVVAPVVVRPRVVAPVVVARPVVPVYRRWPVVAPVYGPRVIYGGVPVVAPGFWFGF